jgi:hypothetical protein
MNCIVKLARTPVLRGIAASALVVFSLGLCPTATAIIVIDDFDDPVLIEDVDGFDESMGIGDLGALRFTAFAGSRLRESSGRLDIATESPGISTATLFSAGTDPGNGNVSAAFHYLYGPFFGISGTTVDFTEGGRNDAVIVDVLSITGETIPRLAAARMISDNGTPLNDNILFNFEPSTEPFRLVFRFEDFRPRGGLMGVPPLDLTRILGVDVIFASHFVETTGQTEEWEVKLDRIWIGPATAVPEPASILLVLVVAACCAPRLVRYVFHGEGRWSHEKWKFGRSSGTLP